jgi:hypothetical protein
MGPVVDGISRVCVLPVAAGAGRAGAIVYEAGWAVVRWRSVWEDKAYQVYVNGRLGGVTVNELQRSCVVALPREYSRGVRIEVVAVEKSQAYEDFGTELTKQQTGRVEIRVGRRNGFSRVWAVRFYSDNGNGIIDYERPLSSVLPFWPVWQDRGGFGGCQFGRSDFGYDGSAAAGFGAGAFGAGEFGFDCDEMVWSSPELATGRYRFGVCFFDSNGRECMRGQAGEKVCVIAPARPARRLKFREYKTQEEAVEFAIE